jgi:hypothetical protein
MDAKEILTMTHTMLPAVDELADVRRTIAELRLREFELCDEIRAKATEIGTRRLAGETRTAMIETRAARFLDVSKLPDAILNDPDMFGAAPQTHVLLWPTAATTRPIPEMQQAPDKQTYMAPVAPAEPANCITAAAAEVAQFTDEGTAQDALSLNLGSPEQNDSLEDVDPMRETIDSPAQPKDADAVASAFRVSAVELVSPAETDSQDTETSCDAPESTPHALMLGDALQDQPIFDIAGDDAPMPAMDMPVLDTQLIAETAEETPPPADLLATQHTDLPPMGDLTDEDLETALHEADSDLPSTVDPQILLETEALQAEFDTKIETSIAIEEEDAATFVTRRIIGIPA